MSRRYMSGDDRYHRLVYWLEGMVIGVCVCAIVAVLLYIATVI